MRTFFGVEIFLVDTSSKYNLKMEFKLFDSIDQMKSVLENKKPRLVRAGEKNICVVRQNDMLIAFENECPHMGESLHNGVLNYLDEIVCPLHAYRFNIESGESKNNCPSLKKVRVLQEKEIILIF
jgi:nitrite reductase/ring-hydroxylating ferredoxin subunit